MALYRRFFYRESPDHLLEISDRVYVFDCCFSTDVLKEDEYKVYMTGIAAQLQEHFPDASFMVVNFGIEGKRSQISDILIEYDMTIMNYPWLYEGCPMLPLEMIHHFLSSSERWLSLEGQQCILLLHCERGGWPVLAFMLAGLLLYRKQYSGEQKTLEMVYKQAPKELLHLLSPLNPQPSQLRYLQYISRRNLCVGTPPVDTPLVLDCIMFRELPLFDRGKRCRPVVHIYGQDPSTPADRSSKLLYTSLKIKQHARYYNQEECMLVKIDINCRIQGDIVLECVHLDDDLVREDVMFKAMFNTGFVRSNYLTLSRDEVDVLRDSKDQFPEDFLAEVLFLDAHAFVATPLPPSAYVSPSAQAALVSPSYVNLLPQPTSEKPISPPSSVKYEPSPPPPTAKSLPLPVTCHAPLPPPPPPPTQRPPPPTAKSLTLLVTCHAPPPPPPPTQRPPPPTAKSLPLLVTCHAPPPPPTTQRFGLTSKEHLRHVAAIIADVLETAETNHVINAAQKRALLQEITLRLS